MIALHEILVAIDFGEPSRAALAYARSVAPAFSARLHLVHVVDDLGAHPTPPTMPAVDLGRLQVELEQEAHKQLEGLMADELRKGPVAVVVLTSSRPASAILAYARDMHIDLIVAGTHGRSGFADLFMGSVAQQIVRSAGCPVLTLRQAAQ
jgi:nucleotide-binding universal stress UspA family protein